MNSVFVVTVTANYGPENHIFHKYANALKYFNKMKDLHESLFGKGYFQEKNNEKFFFLNEGGDEYNLVLTIEDFEDKESDTE